MKDARNKTVSIGFRLTEEEAKKFKKLAEAKKQRTSEYIRNIVKSLINKVNE